jgi:hypothetical protein
MDAQLKGVVGPQANSNGAQNYVRSDVLGGLHVSELLAPYYEAVRQGIVFGALAQTVTAPVIWSTASGQGAPLVYNGTTDKNVVLLAMGVGTLVASTVAGSLGIAVGYAGAVPGSTTVADARWNCLGGGGASAATPYRLGTPANAATSFTPIIRASTTALTGEVGISFVELKGMFVIPPGYFCSIAGSATLSTMQMHGALIWMEVPR